MKFRRLCLFLVAFAAIGDRSPGQGIIADNSAASKTEIANAVAQVCSSDKTTLKSGEPVGCQSCPSGSDFDGQPLGWHLVHITTGHFTSTTQENIILSSLGCESHSNNFGGSFIFLRDTAKPKLLRYNPSLITGRCHKSRFTDGGDFLICQDEYGAQSTVWSFIYAISFDEAGTGNVFSRLFETLDSTQTCGKDSEGKPGGSIQNSKIMSIKFHERNGELIGLSLRATLEKKHLSRIEREACEQNGVRTTSIPEKEYSIDFSLQGHQFKVVPASSAAFELFRKPAFPH
jgi:hypothetical protein